MGLLFSVQNNVEQLNMQKQQHQQRINQTSVLFSKNKRRNGIMGNLIAMCNGPNRGCTACGR